MPSSLVIAPPSNKNLNEDFV